MVVSENFFHIKKVQSEFSVENTLKYLSSTTMIKLFMNQSEFNAPTTGVYGWLLVMYRKMEMRIRWLLHNSDSIQGTDCIATQI